FQMPDKDVKVVMYALRRADEGWWVDDTKEATVKLAPVQPPPSPGEIPFLAVAGALGAAAVGGVIVASEVLKRGKIL
ncbi:MAG: hypothetical protein DRO09_00005, partial [Thermoprotei archaeon]